MRKRLVIEIYPEDEQEIRDFKSKLTKLGKSLRTGLMELIKRFNKI